MAASFLRGLCVSERQALALVKGDTVAAVVYWRGCLSLSLSQPQSEPAGRAGRAVGGGEELCGVSRSYDVRLRSTIVPISLGDRGQGREGSAGTVG